MTKTKPFAALAAVATADPVRRYRIATYERTIDDALSLAVLRASHGLTQQELVRTLEVLQANRSRGEHGDELYRSTLKVYLAARNGELEWTTVFPKRRVRGDNGHTA